MKLLKEMYEGIDYKGYTIEYNLDSVEQMKQQLLDTGNTNITIRVFVVDSKGNRVYSTTKGIADAKKWIEKNYQDEAIKLYNHLLSDAIIGDEVYGGWSDNMVYYSIDGVDDVLDLIGADNKVTYALNDDTQEQYFLWYIDNSPTYEYETGDRYLDFDKYGDNAFTMQFKDILKTYKNELIELIKDALNNK